VKIQYAAVLLTAGIASAMVAAPIAAAAPNCVNIGPNTTQCQNPGGSTQIVTSPPQSNCGAWGCGVWGGYGGWGYGGMLIGF
jgi:hypothetical protein